MVLAGEQPLRDFVDAELRGAWPALTYAVSAWVQQIGGRTLLPEALLTVGALAVASAIVFLIALRLSRRWSVAVLAAAVTIVMTPKLYNYPKVLMLALGVWALVEVVVAPSVLRLGALALATVVAALFRHDLALYIGAAAVAALVARDAGEWKAVVRSVAVYAALTVVLALPSIVWVQVYEGIPSYISGSLASVAVERARTELFLPAFDLAAPFSGESLLLVTYYAFWAVPVVAAAAWLARASVPPSFAIQPIRTRCRCRPSRDGHPREHVVPASQPGRTLRRCGGAGGAARCLDRRHGGGVDVARGACSDRAGSGAAARPDVRGGLRFFRRAT